MNTFRFTLFFVLVLAICGIAAAHSPQFTDTFGQERCNFSSTGKNPYFILQPGYELVLEGEEDGDNVRLVITVLDETIEIDGVQTRVVREKETVNGEVVEVSRNYFAICRPTNSVFYFGEDVNIYEDGQVVSHEGAWRAGVDDARAGIIMPGTLLIGARYFQEIAPEVAMDRAEILKLNAEISTPFDDFTGCLQTRETTPLEPSASEIKTYAPGIGLVKENTLELVSVSTPTATFYPRN